jgi:hypothetical protein
MSRDIAEMWGAEMWGAVMWGGCGDAQKTTSVLRRQPLKQTVCPRQYVKTGWTMPVAAKRSPFGASFMGKAQSPQRRPRCSHVDNFNRFGRARQAAGIP